MTLTVNRKDYVCVKIKLNCDKIQLIGFGDLHIGARTYDEKKATEIRNYIKEENVLWIGMGDFVECATKRSVGAGVYEQIMNPKEQINYLRDFLKPIAKKCIGFVKGNHEERAFKDNGIDIPDILCYELEMPYCGWECFGSICGNHKAYKFYAVHSYMSNKTGGLALNAIERDIEKMFGNFQIIMRGHTHKNVVHIADYFEIDSRNNMVMVRPRVQLITGHYLKRAGSYASARPIRGDPPGTIALELDLRRKKDFIIKPIYL